MTEPLPRPKSRVVATWKLKDQIDDGTISLDADYQREVKWNREKMSYLIDSIFYNYYVPPLLFAIRKVSSKNTRMVIDGKQRLTAIKRFMNNEIPYINPETEEENFYRGDDLGVSYLSEDELEKFDSFEFVCIEYNGITEDDEYSIFSRIQLGISITSQEKLRAHNTPIAKTCRDLAEKFNVIKKHLFKKEDAYLFQTILHMYLTLKNGTSNFQGAHKYLLEFVKLQEKIPNNHHIIINRSLTIISNIANDPILVKKITRGNGGYYINTVEFLLFMMFQKQVKGPRNIKLYAKDIYDLREYILSKRNGKVTIGKDTFLSGMRFVRNRLEEGSVAPIAVVENMESSRYEVKQESSSTSSHSRQVTSSIQKRLRDSNVPIARRGGKFFRGSQRTQTS